MLKRGESKFRTERSNLDVGFFTYCYERTANKIFKEFLNILKIFFYAGAGSREEKRKFHTVGGESSKLYENKIGNLQIGRKFSPLEFSINYCSK